MDAGRDNPDTFAEGVAGFIESRSLLARGASIVVGVSGGADSVALLAVLRELAARSRCAYRLTVAHLNHRLRDDAEADELFVAQLARRWGIPCVIARRDVGAEARRTSQSIEQTARTLRYEFLRSAARDARAGYVAVGHHADDNVETILYRIVRGTHLRGLAGIPESRPLGEGVTLVRPLLSSRRSEIEDFCTRSNLAWRTDPTNTDTAYRRNFIRHELLPLLREKLNPRTDEALLRLGAAGGKAEAVLRELGDAALARAAGEQDDRRIVLDPEVMRAEKPVIRAYALRAAMERLGAPLRMIGAERLAETARLAEAGPPAAVTLPGGFAVRRETGRIVVEKSEDPRAAAGGDDAVVAMQCPGRTVLPDGRAVSCRLEPFEPDAFAEHCRNHPPGVELLDADRLGGALTIRSRLQGDAFRPLGASGRQSVGDFLTNLKLPRSRRERVLCICDESGIVYLAPLRIDDRVKITSATRRVLRIHLSPDNSAGQ